MAADAPSWDRAARGYARQEPLEHQAIARALELAATGPRDRLLDVATGTGIVLRTLARRPGRPAEAIGVDRSGAMLARVGALPAGWHVERGDAIALPVATASVDVAIAAYLLHILSPGARAAALAQLRRVLRPTGRLVVVTPFTRRRASAAVLRALAAAAPEALAGLRPLDPRPELAAAGWTLERGAVLHHGYPSLVVRARPG